MISTKQALSKVPLLAELSDVELDLLTELASIRKFEKNETIIHKQDVGDTFFSLISGRVKVVLTDDEGKEFIVGVLQENDFFGELSIIDGEPRSATVVAIEPTETVVLKRKEFISHMMNHPGIGIKVMVELARRIRRSNNQIESLAFLDVCGRLARVLLDMGKSQGAEQHDGIKVTIHHSRTELANLIGTTRETLTRAMKTLETMGYVKISKTSKNVLYITNYIGLTNRVG